ncbi:MAG TPA: endolytic transglycosylase MltG [Casimicrobiaceae bacterium]|nr:endolytic transglycosylase MltG [Casimicrobiaceae bacterium]
MEFLRRFLKTFILLVVVAGAAAAVAFWWYLSQPLKLPRAPYDFNVPAGSTLSGIARDLAADRVIAHPLPLVALARIKGVDRAIKAGSYEVESGTTLERLLERLTQGDVTQTSITIVEGTTFSELRTALKANPNVAKTVIDLSDGELAERFGLAPRHLEGRFFPDTYFFAAGSADMAILKRAQRLMEQRLAASWDKRAPDVPFATPYEALILASIVEKETGRAVERPLIASVFVNRMKQRMRLQTDPTVIYGMGDAFDGNLRKRDLEADTPYNTYTRNGLPPTPIAMPSQASIDAVMNPPATSYLYFVARGDGGSAFSTTLAEHNRAVAKYQLKRGGS